MLLNEKQLKILQVIEAGNTTGEAIAEAMGSSTQMLKYYLDKLAEDGYVKTAKVYDKTIQDFLIVRAYLTPQGQAELGQLRGSITLQPIPGSGQPAPRSHISMNPLTVSAVSSEKPPAPRANIPHPPDQSQPLGVQDFGEIIKLIDTFEQILSILTKENRDLATVYLTDLQTEIKVPYHRDMKRINAYLKAFLQVARSRSGPTVDDVMSAAHVVITKLNLPPDGLL
jgi:DeoR family transcriptional regulator, catabolite repression regulator